MNRTTNSSGQVGTKEWYSLEDHKVMLTPTTIPIFGSLSVGSTLFGRSDGENQRRARTMFLFFFLALSLSGCGKSVLPTPVSISYRASFFYIGQVVVITNNSNHHLYNVRVTGRNLQQLSSASVRASEHLHPGETIEVGWIEFGSWIPMPGETIEVYADDYLSPKISYVPN